MGYASASPQNSRNLGKVLAAYWKKNPDLAKGRKFAKKPEENRFYKSDQKTVNKQKNKSKLKSAVKIAMKVVAYAPFHFFGTPGTQSWAKTMLFSPNKKMALALEADRLRRQKKADHQHKPQETVQHRDIKTNSGRTGTLRVGTTYYKKHLTTSKEGSFAACVQVTVDGLSNPSQKRAERNSGVDAQAQQGQAAENASYEINAHLAAVQAAGRLGRAA